MKDRADKVMADLGLVSSRSQAKSLIEKGDVFINEKQIKKGSELIDQDAKIEIKAQLYVGRGAFKLEKAIEVFHLNFKDKVTLDVGASTGGFTEVMLMNGAQKVYAIDVGHDQLAQKLRDDVRVINLEGTNIKDLSELPELADGAVMDLSFISITKVLDALKNLLKPNAFLMALIKPQFEAGIERLPKDGVIKDDKIREEILNEVITFAENNGWKLLAKESSPIQGKSGNIEFIAHFVKL